MPTTERDLKLGSLMKNTFTFILLGLTVASPAIAARKQLRPVAAPRVTTQVVALAPAVAQELPAQPVDPYAPFQLMPSGTAVELCNDGDDGACARLYELDRTGSIGRSKRVWGILMMIAGSVGGIISVAVGSDMEDPSISMTGATLGLGGIGLGTALYIRGVVAEKQARSRAVQFASRIGMRFEKVGLPEAQAVPQEQKQAITFGYRQDY